MALAAVVLATAYTAGTASNTVPPTRAGLRNYTNTATEFRPTVCAGIAVTTVITGTSNAVNGSNGNDLILGGTGATSLDGKNGNDCLVGGATVTSIYGGGGTDVCIGKNGTTFSNCSTITRW